MSPRSQFAAALLAELVGSAGVLLLATRTWQTVTTARPRPFAADVLAVSGRTLDGAPTALGLVALAGVVAVLATKGAARRGIGVLVVVAGLGVAWRSAAGVRAVTAARAVTLVRDAHPRAAASAGVVPAVGTHPAWPVLSVACGVLLAAAGVLVAWRGHTWRAMSARYERPGGAAARPPTAEDVAAARARADASLWSALERGEDPTLHDPRDRG